MASLPQQPTIGRASSPGRRVPPSVIVPVNDERVTHVVRDRLERDAFVFWAESAGLANDSLLTETGCDVLDRLWEVEGVSGYNQSTESVEVSTFVRSAAEAFGDFAYFDAANHLLRSRNPALVSYAVFHPYPRAIRERYARARLPGLIRNQGLGAVDSVLANIGTCISLGGSPSTGATDAMYVEGISTALLNRRQQQGIDRAARTVNLASVVPRGATRDQVLGATRERPGHPVMVHQPIVGDGACLYRAIAASILYAVSGRSFGSGMDELPSSVLRGDPHGFLDIEFYHAQNGARQHGYQITESDVSGEPIDVESHRRLHGALATQALTMWVKWYTFALACTNARPEVVSWRTGIIQVNGVTPVSNPAWFAGDLDAASTDQVSTDTCAVPSLSCVVSWLAFLEHLRYPDGGYPSWEALRPLARGILAAPWWQTKALGALPVEPVGRTFALFRPISSDSGIVLEGPQQSLGLVLEGSVTDEETARYGSRWKAFVAQSTKYDRYGGLPESVVFGSLLARGDASLPRYIDIWIPAGVPSSPRSTNTNTNSSLKQYQQQQQQQRQLRIQWPTAAYPNTTHTNPDTGRPIAIDATRSINVIHIGAHYESLLPIPIDPITGNPIAIPQGNSTAWDSLAASAVLPDSPLDPLFFVRDNITDTVYLRYDAPLDEPAVWDILRQYTGRLPEPEGAIEL